jgi:valyl-tRNA synthetase
LYTALETALLLSHPFLPFITEELWQRIPRRPGDKTESIMIAKYPTPYEDFANSEAEAAYQLVLDCSAAIRSLKAEFPSKEAAQGAHSLQQVFLRLP